MQIQTPGAELPLARVAISALEVGRASLAIRIDIPAATTLVGDQGQSKALSYLVDEGGIMKDRFEAVGDGEIGPLEVA